MLYMWPTTQLVFVQKWIQRVWDTGSKYGTMTNRSTISNTSVAHTISTTRTRIKNTRCWYRPALRRHQSQHSKLSQIS